MFILIIVDIGKKVKELLKIIIDLKNYLILHRDMDRSNEDL